MPSASIPNLFPSNSCHLQLSTLEAATRCRTKLSPAASNRKVPSPRVETPSGEIKPSRQHWALPYDLAHGQNSPHTDASARKFSFETILHYLPLSTHGGGEPIYRVDVFEAGLQDDAVCSRTRFHFPERTCHDGTYCHDPLLQMVTKQLFGPSYLNSSWSQPKSFSVTPSTHKSLKLCKLTNSAKHQSDESPIESKAILKPRRAKKQKNRNGSKAHVN